MSDRPTAPQGGGAPDPEAGPHLSLDTLADLAEGLLSTSETAAADGHLASCATCRSARGELARLSGLLAAVPAVPMPVSVADRITAALAAEAAERHPAAGAPPSDHPVVTSLDAARERRGAATVRRAAAALVGVAAVLGGGFLFGDVLFSADSADDGAESAAAGGASDTADGSAPMASEPEPAPHEVGSGIAYSDETLLADVQQLLTLETLARVPTAAETASPDASREQFPEDSELFADEDSSARCVDAVVAQVAGRPSPLAVDLGTFDGMPAVVVVVPLVRSADAEAEVWVVSADCLTSADGDLDVLDRALVADVPGRS